VIAQAGIRLLDCKGEGRKALERANSEGRTAKAGRVRAHIRLSPIKSIPLR
jgi:hypothetical protein